MPVRAAAFIAAALAVAVFVFAIAQAPAASSRVDLRIAIQAQQGSPPASRIWRLRCDPDSGDWPRRGAACNRMTAKLLAPIGIEVRDLVPITSQPVRVSGRAFGRAVSLSFPARGSSTRRARFRALRSALGPAAFAEAQRRSR